MIAYPRDLAAPLNLGIVYGLQGQYEKAVEVTRQALRIEDNMYSTRISPPTLLPCNASTKRVRSSAMRSREKWMMTLHNILYVLGFFGADSAAMAEQQQWYAGKPEYEGEGLALASDTEAYAGHLGKARELTKRAVDSAIRVDNKETAAAIWLAMLCKKLLSAMPCKPGGQRQRL